MPVRLETAPTGVVERVYFASFVSTKHLANEPLSCVLLLSVVVLFINAQAPEVSKIAFGSGLRHPGNPLVRSEIYVMDEDGNNQLNIPDNPANDRNPSWSPDGTVSSLFPTGMGTMKSTL